MRTSGWALIAVMLILGLAGCRIHPAYKAAELAPDPEFIGVWRVVHPSGDGFDLVRVSKRMVPLNNGRLSDLEIGVSSAGECAETYLIEMTDTGETPETVQLFGYLVRAGTTRVLGIELSNEQIKKSKLAYPMALPVHMILRYQREGDRLTLSWPDVEIVWIPGIRSVDEAPNARRDVSLRQLKDEKSELLFVHDIDRLVELYATYSNEPGMWTDKDSFELVREPLSTPMP